MREREIDNSAPKFFYDPVDGPWLILPHRMPRATDPHEFYRLLIRPQSYEGRGNPQKIVSECYIDSVTEELRWRNGK